MPFSEISLNSDLVEKTKALTDDIFPAALGTLGQLVKIPGIAWPSFDPAELERSARAVADELGKLEFFDFVDVRRSKRPSGEDGAPAVLARRQGSPDAPHVLLYAHHDVQPPGERAYWDSEPFEATLKGERLYGRGAADDKAGVVTHLTALRGLKTLAEELRIGVTVFIEGEEEAGSESFLNFLNDNRDELRADLIVVADSGNWSEDVPALTTSLRGVLSQTFTVRTLDHALHSGMYGGPVPDAMTAMIKLLASLHDEKGDVAIMGLKSDATGGPEVTNEQLAKESGMLYGVERLGTKAITQQIWGEPAVTVIGIDFPSVAISSNTAQPAVTAKISLRLAPSEDPTTGLELLRKHLTEHAPFGARVEFGHHEQGPGYLAKNGWASKLSHSILSAVWPQQSVDIGVGGSIPFISLFAQLFPDAEILVTGVEDPDSRAHSPNESQHLPTLRRAITAETLLLLHGNQMWRKQLN
jgi:acetylornithine deacetylase/succinyl-diaminopimelate desuccinylase-like protein